MVARGPYAKGVAKRQEILDAGLLFFAQKGYDRVSIREIARHVGLTQAGLLHHFGSKEELFLELLQRRDDRFANVTEEPHRHSVTHLIEAVERNTLEPGLVRLFVTMSAESTDSDSPSRAFFVERYDWLRKEVAADIRGQQGRGELSSSLDADDVAAILIAAADGLQLQWLLQPEQVQMTRLLTLLWSALRKIS